MTTSERAAIARLFAEAGRILRNNPADEVESVETPEPEPAPVETVEEAPTPEVVAEPDVHVIVAQPDDERYARKSQRGLIARLSDTDYNPSSGLRRNMAAQTIEALLDLNPVNLVIGDDTITLTPNPQAVEAYFEYRAAKAEAA